MKGDNIAAITIERAFETSKIIRSYEGEEITLIYKGASPELNNCPNLRVDIKDVRRNIDFSQNNVTLKISNISNDLAKGIEKHLCLIIDTTTLKKVSSINFDPNSDGGLKELVNTLNN